MAGSIIIDFSSGVSLNSYDFDVVVEGTRRVLREVCPELIAHIYDSMDVECMQFIRLDAINPENFKKFYLATKSAFLEWQGVSPQPFPGWSELIVKLEADERLKAD